MREYVRQSTAGLHEMQLCRVPVRRCEKPVVTRGLRRHRFFAMIFMYVCGFCESLLCMEGDKCRGQTCMCGA